MMDDNHESLERTLCACPFCGAETVDVTVFDVGSKQRLPSIYAVLCQECGARGPTSANWDAGIGRLAATLLWNNKLGIGI